MGLTSEAVSDPDDDDFFENNCRKGKRFPMGSTCPIKVKEVHCLYWSTKGSTILYILTDVLATVHHHDI